MPIITIQAIEGVVLTSKEQKEELLKKMTDTFIEVVGEVARPYTYCVIQETPLGEWSIAGHPLPDLPWLYGPEYAEMHKKANEVMRAYTGDVDESAEEAEKRRKAEDQWGHLHDQ
jgi:4-oxalocrotonate tautomerase